MPLIYSFLQSAEQCRIKTLVALVHSENEAPKIQLGGLGERYEQGRSQKFVLGGIKVFWGG